LTEENTIISDSSLGKRLSKIPKKVGKYLLFQGKSIPLTAKITIGRAHSNNIIIDDHLTSRFHAVIHKIKSDYFLKDLCSTNGTFVNGTEVPKDKYIKLEGRDVIKIGRVEISIK
jgi:pSer/pThr/pTyr-binding forkhead associated (FHA) protein